MAKGERKEDLDRGAGPKIRGLGCERRRPPHPGRRAGDGVGRSRPSGIEKTIVHYGKSTGFFSDKMLERGPAYLSAAVLYENLVIQSYDQKHETPFPLVAIYPVEGTFWSDHPYAVLDAPWVGTEEREAAQKFLAFLKDKPQQTRALALGFRPADTSIPMDSPIDAAHGVDPKQPQTLLDVPDAATLDGLLALWRENKKTADVTLVFDKSGSMAGRPLAQSSSARPTRSSSTCSTPTGRPNSAPSSSPRAKTRPSRSSSRRSCSPSGRTARRSS